MGTYLKFSYYPSYIPLMQGDKKGGEGKSYKNKMIV